MIYCPYDEDDNKICPDFICSRDIRVGERLVGTSLTSKWEVIEVIYRISDPIKDVLFVYLICKKVKRKRSTNEQS